MSASSARLGLAAPDTTTRLKEVASLAIQARTLGLTDVRVSLAPQMLKDTALRTLFESPGVHFLVNVNGSAMAPGTLASVLQSFACSAAAEASQDPGYPRRMRASDLGERGGRVLLRRLLREDGSPKPALERYGAVAQDMGL